MAISEKHIGKTYLIPGRYPVTSLKSAEFANAIGESQQQFVPPTFCVTLATRAWEYLFADPELSLELSRTVHIEQEFMWYRPLEIGDEITTYLTIEAVRRMGARAFVTISVSLVVSGELVITSKSLLLHTDAEPDRNADAEPDRNADAEPEHSSVGETASAMSTTNFQLDTWRAPQAEIVPVPNFVTAARLQQLPALPANFGIGTETPKLTVAVTREMLVRYAGASGDFNPIHYSDTAAQAIGLPGVLAHGLLTTALALRVVTNWLGGVHRLQRFKTRFSQPLLVPDTNDGVSVEFGGVVAKLEAGLATINLVSSIDKVLTKTEVEVISD